MQAEFEHKWNSYAKDMAKKLRKIEDENANLRKKRKEDESKRHSVRYTK